MRGVWPSEGMPLWRRLRWGLSSAWVVVPARVLVAGVFVFAGFSKLLLPHAEVMALMQQYEVIPRAVIPLLATCLPWIEILSGTALLVGFYTTPTALAIAGQLVSFSILMVVVMLSGIVIADCGCFGNLGWRETPLHVLIRDLIMLGMIGAVLTRRRDVWALDAWIQGETPQDIEEEAEEETLAG